MAPADLKGQLELPEGRVKKGIFFVSEEPTEPKDLVWTWSHSSTPPRRGPCRYQSLRGVAFLLEAWGLGGGPGKNLLSKWFEHFQLCPVLCPATPCVQHPIHPIIYPPLLKGSPQGFLQFSTQPSAGVRLGSRRGGRAKERIQLESHSHHGNGDLGGGKC